MVKVFLVAAMTMVGTAAFAADAGCGLGSVIIQKNAKVQQLLAWTTNGLLFTQPLGITFGTSGCTSRAIVKNDKQIQYFVEVNHDDLSREMAQGQGEKLSTLAQLHGCQSAEAQSAFATMTQTSFDKIIPSAQTAPTDMVQNIQKEISQNQKVAGLCQVASL